MKKIILLFLLLAIVGKQYAQSYKIEAKDIKISSSAATRLAEYFEKYEVVNLGVEKLLDERSNGNPITVDLALPNVKAFTASLSEVKYYDTSLEAIIQTENGPEKGEVSDIVTYHGTIADNPNAQVILVIGKGLVSGKIDFGNGNTFLIEPFQYYQSNAAGYSVVIYHSSDVLEGDVSRPCLLKAVEQASSKPHLEKTAGPDRCSVKVIEIGNAYDYGMLEWLGSLSAVYQHCLTIHSLMQSNYDDEFANPVRLKLAGIFISACEGCDPWSGTLSKGELLFEFCDWINEGGFGAVAIDYGQIFSPRPFEGILFASFTTPNGLCNDCPATVISFYDPPLCTQQKISSRALARSLGSMGSPSTGITSSGGTCTNYWAQIAIDEINYALETKPCIGSCVVLPPTQPLIFNYIFTPTQVCYTFDNFCIAKFQVSTDDPNLSVTTAGTTICLQSNVYNPRRARVFVNPFDYCGKGSDLAIAWTVWIDTPLGIAGERGETPQNSIEGSTSTQTSTAAVIFPNPAKDYFSLYFHEEFSGNIKIVNLVGQKIDELYVEPTTALKWDCSALPAGVYWLFYEEKGQLRSHKLIKQ